MTLLSLIMPDELEGFAEMSDAIEVARRMPVTVDRESADSWVAGQLAELPEGVATVLFHYSAADLGRCELRPTVWPGDEERLLGVGRHHRAPVDWKA